MRFFKLIVVVADEGCLNGSPSTPLPRTLDLAESAVLAPIVVVVLVLAWVAVVVAANDVTSESTRLTGSSVRCATSVDEVICFAVLRESPAECRWSSLLLF